MCGAKRKGKRNDFVILMILTALSAGTLTLAVLYFRGYIWYIQYTLYVLAGLILLFGYYCYFFEKPQLFRLSFTLACSAFALMGGYALLELCGFFEKFSNFELLKNFILSTGIWGKIIFVGIEILQVVILPVPAMILYLAGIAVFGPFVTTLLASAGVIIGSMIAFAIGRVFGKRLVDWIAGREKAEKYRRMLNKGKFLFILMLLFPVFPDDLICMVAGMTTMSYLFFGLSVLIIRPALIAFNCYLGSGMIIPFSGWGLIVWPALIAGIGVLFWLAVKYQERISDWLSAKFKRKNKAALAAEAAAEFAPEFSEPVHSADLELKPKNEPQKDRIRRVKHD